MESGCFSQASKVFLLLLAYGSVLQRLSLSPIILHFQIEIQLQNREEKIWSWGQGAVRIILLPWKGDPDVPFSGYEPQICH